MDTFWICIALLSISFGVQGLHDPLSDYNSSNDKDYEWYSDELERLGVIDSEAEKLNNKIIPTNKIQNEDRDTEEDRKVAQDIEKFINNNEAVLNPDLSADALEDYQIEDNRSEDDKSEIIGSIDKTKASKEVYNDRIEAVDDLAADIADLNRIKASLDDDKDAVKKLTVSDSKVEPMSPIKNFDIDTNDISNNPDSENKSKSKEIFAETDNILREDDETNDFLKVIPITFDKSNLNDTLEETLKILESIDDKLDEDKNTDKIIGNQELDDLMADLTNQNSLEEAYGDLVDNYGNLSETWDRIKNFDFNDTSPTDDEEEINRIYKTFINLAKDYEVVDDDNLETLFADDNIETSVEEDIFSDDNLFDEDKIPMPIEYLNDALNASDEAKNPDAEMISINESSKDLKEMNATSTTSPSVDYSHLSQIEYDQLMYEFESNHSDDFNFKSENFDKHIAPIHITIDTEPVVVTSPNYPNNYPTNNIIDWIFYGEGEGIEFNITDFAVNGHLGDYLLVKPGGVDASGNKGLIFSYTLNSKRYYRFLDVNRMFVRFEARPGMQFMRGFNFTVKLLRHIPYEPEPEPTPEPIRPPPDATITINLGGTTLDNFVNHPVEEEFRQIVADMATLYINANNIEPGLNTTSEVTQIVSRALCFHNWPKFEDCVEVTFGVPLEYDGEEEPRLTADDLTTMWSTYFGQDPFATRLRRLGITEYQVPNDKGVLTVWLVIAAGVLISVAMLAFALWRFSCFEDYSRMPSYNDTDSVHEKRNLDLYPTPHQTLPPLFAEHEYKWSEGKYDGSTRVEIAGYANKNYLPDDLYDLDSDDEVVNARTSKKDLSSRSYHV